jgi:predicted enzyme related to lactoylglutathione lyase
METPTGLPCWYELATVDLAAAGTFYAAVFDWQIADSGMTDFTYHLASRAGHGVAGLMSTAGQPQAAAPAWVVYFTTASVDDAVAVVTAAGGQVYAAPADIPGTGRFAIVADPLGATFGLLAPLPMESTGDEPMVSAYDQSRPGHGNWHELTTSDPERAMSFYEKLFGWRRTTAMDMGADGVYQLFAAAEGGDLGGMMGLMGRPAPSWLPYFGTDGVTETMARIEAGGGAIQHGPHEVPGGAFIAIATDPQGASFAVVGPRQLG